MKRFAVYHAPRPGNFADRAAHWLGRNAETGSTLQRPALPGVAEAADPVAEARRYGFHGTIRAPFRLAPGIGQSDLESAVAELAGRLAPARTDGLRLADMDGFLALVPDGDAGPLIALAAAVVDGTNTLRDDLTGEEMARRRPEHLTPRQRELLALWGYPYVMEEFAFHLTLTDRLPPRQRSAVMLALRLHFEPVLPRPFIVEDLCLFGEDAEGVFHLLHRYALTG